MPKRNNAETVLGAIVSFIGVFVLLLCLSVGVIFAGVPMIIRSIRIDKIEAAVEQELARTQHARITMLSPLDVGHVLVPHPDGGMRTVVDMLRELPEGTTLHLYPEVKVVVP